jgi:hypothetical protein
VDSGALAHDSVAQDAATHLELKPVVPMPIAARRAPVQGAGHAEMHEQLTVPLGHWQDQPLAVPPGAPEPLA